MEGLGRLFNAHYPANDDYVSLENASAVTFFVYEVDGSTSVTITTSDDAAGSHTATNDLVSRWYESSADQNNGVWVEKTQVPSETFNPSNGTGDLAAVTIHAAQLPDGHKYVKATADGSAIVFAVLHDLTVQRAPQNLKSVIA
jgi:hypothetical protein